MLYNTRCKEVAEVKGAYGRRAHLGGCPPDACVVQLTNAADRTAAADETWGERSKVVVRALNLREHLEVCFDFDPTDFAQQYQSQWGAGFSIAPIFTQSAFFRFHNRAEDFENLYFVGAGTHPGAGVPGVISSAKVIEELLYQDCPELTPAMS